MVEGLLPRRCKRERGTSMFVTHNAALAGRCRKIIQVVDDNSVG